MQGWLFGAWCPLSIMFVHFRLLAECLDDPPIVSVLTATVGPSSQAC